MKNQPIFVRVPPAELDWLRAAAEKTRQTVGDYIRHLIRQRMDREARREARRA